MNSETKTCQNCKQNFIIEPEDFEFYAKIKVQRRLFVRSVGCRGDFYLEMKDPYIKEHVICVKGDYFNISQ